MRPKVRSNGPKMSALDTPYEGYRRRVRLMEKIEALRLQASASVARRSVARATRLTPDQLVSIRKGRPKDLYGNVKQRIDEAFLAVAQGARGALAHEMAMASASARGIDPRLVAEAQAQVDALEQLIGEAHRADTRLTEESTP